MSVVDLPPRNPHWLSGSTSSEMDLMPFNTNLASIFVLVFCLKSR